MKKKLLAVGIAAALVSGAASAAVTVNDTGVGHINILPYYSVQEGNATLISITNTDLVKGKAVKVRFRGAKTSDDVFDFQVFLSPGDVWTGAVTLNGDVAKMTTTDKSCTLPANVSQDFVTARLQEAEKATGTREGYVEIINMGDIVAGTGLYAATKHVNGVAPCTASVLVGSDTLVPVDHSDALDAPTSGLTSFATIINVPSSKAFTIAATALSPETDPADDVYYRQANIPVTYSENLTADQVFNPAQGAVEMYEFDLPDLSTPYGEGATAALQRDAVTAALAKPGVMTEFVTDDNVLATTDVVLSQPTRRYYYTWADVPGLATDPLKTLATINGATGSYATLAFASNSIEVGTPRFTDREEGVILSPTSIVISPNPQPAAGKWNIEGEVAVIAINNGDVPTGSLGASLTAQDYTTSFTDGWVNLSTTTAVGGTELPVIGFSAINVYNASVASGTNYGLALPLRVVAP